jgi:hypothetical protein
MSRDSIVTHSITAPARAPRYFQRANTGDRRGKKTETRPIERIVATVSKGKMIPAHSNHVPSTEDIKEVKKSHWDKCSTIPRSVLVAGAKPMTTGRKKPTRTSELPARVLIVGRYGNARCIKTPSFFHCADRMMCSKETHLA